ncbi:MAG: DUF401 family protein [Desulfomonilia bacterium]|jgi:integral membrane protein (TIGR00529 family)|uniref:DUF401 family protein n=1 Tax=anaerobic digester metagenome TaxID=1263854 RepID=A0A485M474_9ZZZZ|nr:DUF401 family protein [Pseudomonadota bacterium]HPD21535.1 DUF401 family protein [Deltaproteobacteria bacterium]HPX18749.1 DUF401 family protein [Deltaproteobacteria bacterium]HRS56083.1 DUF401 family protein [Desulfomonilia bacterium]HRV35800.1 DUF401 family protein [Desulfomonilia bacterium]
MEGGSGVLIMEVSAIFKLAIVFVLMLAAIRRGISLGNTFVMSSVLLGVLFGLDATSMAASALSSVLSSRTIALCAVVSLILILSTSMEVSGHMSGLLANFRGMVRSPRVNLAIFPALIGLLPMPGGAVFSAPMVREIGASTSLGPHELSYVNYWFRHVWEYWWPLYPGIILAVALADVGLWTAVIYLFPLTLVALGAGYYPLAGNRLSSEHAGETGRPPIWPFIRELVPILLVIVMGFGLGEIPALLLPGWFPAKDAALVLSLAAASGWVWARNRLDAGTIRSIILSPKLLGMIYMVASIMVFQGVMEDSRAVEAVSAELKRLSVPLVAVVMMLPFMVGAIMGITVAFVGSTFPILIALLVSLGKGDILLPYLMLALVSGFVGVLLSPLHLCLLLSNKYFGASMRGVYRYLWLPSAAILASAVLYFVLSLLVVESFMR